MLLPLAAPSGAGAVLAVLLGVNIGPDLLYTGSLATLLRRRVLRAHGADTDRPDSPRPDEAGAGTVGADGTEGAGLSIFTLEEFTRLEVLTVLPGLALSVVALWLGLHAFGG